MPAYVARIFHQVSTAAADAGMSAALHSVGFLDVLSNTPAESSGRAPCSYCSFGPSALPRYETCRENAANHLVGPGFSPDGLIFSCAIGSRKVG
jgi:hypothetical protein